MKYEHVPAFFERPGLEFETEPQKKDSTTKFREKLESVGVGKDDVKSWVDEYETNKLPYSTKPDVFKPLTTIKNGLNRANCDVRNWHKRKKIINSAKLGHKPKSAQTEKSN